MIAGVQEGTRLAVSVVQAGTREVELGVAATREAGVSLRQIIDISDRVGEMVTHIATAALEQSSATAEVNQSTERIADIAALSATGALQATKALEDLANLAAEIQKQVGQFRLESGGGSSTETTLRNFQAHAAASGL
jgi:methyl-accepting chemotaxis protein